jgi:hypothetical protein
MMLRVSLFLYKSDAVRSYGLPTEVSYGCFQLFCSLCLPVIIIKMAIPNYAAQNSRGKEQKSPKFGHAYLKEDTSSLNLFNELVPVYR